MYANIVELPSPQRKIARPETLGSPLPVSLVFTERAAASLRDYLDRAGLGQYRMFYSYMLDVDLDDIEAHLESLGESTGWEPLPPLAGGAAGLANLKFDHDNSARGQEPGCLYLRRHEVVIARWFWVNVTDNCVSEVWLGAAPTHAHYARLREELKGYQHGGGARDWRIVHGAGPGERVPRTEQAADELILCDRVRERIEAEVVQFFCPAAAAMYASLRVPYRRGVLMHGPPGNGKTSLIRYVGASLPNIPGFILRPAAGFDADDLSTIIRRWTRCAPAILVIEDLDWLLERIDVSAFLNLIDGVESAATGGLLLLATTNNPEKLDPALNNRPGRFDVVIEVPSPDEPLRAQYLQRYLPDIALDVIAQVAADTSRLAFAHLQEIVRLSGLIAINAGRSTRIGDDVIQAARTVRDTFDDAIRGFPMKAEMPFGLAHLRRKTTE